MKESIIDIAVLGGGAAGLMAANRALDERFSVTVFERMSRTGKKLLATGNGRCNLTNQNAGMADYHGGTGLMARAMARYSPERVIDIFHGLGVLTHTEGDGKVYPLSDQAASVLDALRLSILEKGGVERTDFEAAALCREGDLWIIRAASGETARARRVIVATGGLTAPNLGGSPSGHKLLKALGHHVTPCHPALTQLRTPTEPIRALKGLKYTGEIAVYLDGDKKRTEWGEVLFTEYGLSGPPVLQLSRGASVGLSEGKSVEVSLHLLSWAVEEILGELHYRRARLPRRTAENLLTGFVNKRIGQTVVKQLGVALSEPIGALNDGALLRIARRLHRWVLPVVGAQPFAHAQVTAGGIRTDEVDPETLESRLVPHLYIVGEALDIDGDCGGYNLQWAWASGLLAAESACNSLGEKR